MVGIGPFWYNGLALGGNEVKILPESYRKSGIPLNFSGWAKYSLLILKFDIPIILLPTWFIVNPLVSMKIPTGLITGPTPENNENPNGFDFILRISGWEEDEPEPPRVIVSLGDNNGLP